MGLLPPSSRLRPQPLLGLLLMVLTSGCARQKVPQNAAADRQTEKLDSYVQLLRTSVDAAERVCLSNTSSQQAVSVVANWRAKLDTLNSGATIEKKTEVIRGAARSLPDSAQLIEDDNIRNCMNKQIQPIFSLAVRYVPTEKDAAWPEPIDFRFNFIRGPSKNTTMYGDSVRLDLQTSRGPESGRLVPEEPQGARYYKMYVRYPQDGEIVRGTIVAEQKGDARLASGPPTITDVCFQRPSGMPSPPTTDYDLFDCTEGKTCGPSTRSTGWLQACSQKPQTQTFRFVPPVLESVYAATQQHTDPATPDQPYWSVPSAAALAEAKGEGVGYTIFSVETDAFRSSEVNGIEVDLRVNGVPVREDGLPPELRPIANDPENSFLYRFALQTLDFQGAQGCERIDLGLRPLLVRRRKGQARTTTLSYVARRDVPPHVVPFGNARLKWSAAYITPEREWRHLAEIHSYTYRVRDQAAQNSALERSKSDKRWLDSQALNYQGQRVVGIIRPPRTVKPDGTAAYGLAAGVIQETRQVRFTFSEPEARRLAAFMIAQRRHSAEGARIIDSVPYIFQAVGGSRTVTGICGN